MLLRRAEFRVAMRSTGASTAAGGDVGVERIERAGAELDSAGVEVESRVGSSFAAGIGGAICDRIAAAFRQNRVMCRAS